MLVIVMLAMQTAGGALPNVSASRDDKLICKAVQETGSLIGKRRRCLSAEDWERVRLANEKRRSATK